MKRPALIRCGLLLAIGAALSACGGDLNDLHSYAADVKARKPSGIEPLPEVVPYKHFEYQAEDLRNPFDPSVLAPQTVTAQAKTNGSAISPDPNRAPEFLESFPLDTLRMVGSLSQEGQLWALIQTPDDTIQRVSAGDYMGHNNGRIIQVSDSGVALEEIVPDGIGGWMTRDAAVALSE